MAKSMSQLNEQEKISLIRDVASFYGRESAGTIASRHGCEPYIISTIASQLRKRSVALPRFNGASYQVYTEEFVRELNDIVRKRFNSV